MLKMLTDVDQPQEGGLVRESRAADHVAALYMLNSCCRTILF